MSAVKVEFTPDGYFEFNRQELEAEFARAQELPPGREEQLGYEDMLALADMFEGWALGSNLSPLHCASYSGLAQAYQTLADEVGPDWNPKIVPPLGLLSALARDIRG